MAMAPLSAADLGPELLAELRAALPEQVGDDLVLRLADGRIFFIDGFFAPDELGDGLAPIVGAIELEREIADLLLGEPDVETAAGPAEPPGTPSDGARFQTFETMPSPQAERKLQPAELSEREGDPDAIPSASGNDMRAPLRTDTFYRPESAGTGHLPTPLSWTAIGTLSLAAAGNSAPTFDREFSFQKIVALENLLLPDFEGWFDGLSRIGMIGDPIAADDFAARYDPDTVMSPETLAISYAGYLVAHADVQTFAAGRRIWTNVPSDNDASEVRDNSAETTLPPAYQPASRHFVLDELIIGGDYGIDRLYGFAGDDILIGYGGENHLFGGDGNDVLVSVQSDAPLHVDGGDGMDTLILLVHNQTQPFFARDMGTITSIERLTLLPENPLNPLLLSEEGGWNRIVSGNFILDLDADTILAWGGSLVVDPGGAAVRLSDVSNWRRLPEDPNDPLYIHYQAEVAGKTVSLSVLASADQPIATHVVGTSADDIFYLGDRIFGHYDGGAGNDQIQGSLNGQSLGTLDLSNPNLSPFSNIESVLLTLPTDHLLLSATGIVAATDSRNTLWAVGNGFGANDLFSGGLNSGDAKGIVELTDPLAWTALGYLSLFTSTSPDIESRIGAIYGSTVGRDNVYLFVQLGMEQPIVGNTAPADHWFVNHLGQVNLPPAGIILDLSTINLTNGSDNLIMFDVASAMDIAGADLSLTIIGDGAGDAVEFVDAFSWHFSHTSEGFSVYTGQDQSGKQVELRVATNLSQPYLLPDHTLGDLDAIDMSNGHANLLRLDVVTASEIAGTDGHLTISGDWYGDTVTFTDPQNWKLTDREFNFLVYEGDDHAGHQVALHISMDVKSPRLFPEGTDNDDRLNVIGLQEVEQFGIIDGKDGFDILGLFDEGAISPRLDSLKSIEAINLANDASNTLTLNSTMLAHNGVSGPVFIIGDAEDVVVLDRSYIFDDAYQWVDIGTVITNPALSDHNFDVFEALVRHGGSDITVQVAIDQTLLQTIIS